MAARLTLLTIACLLGLVVLEVGLRANAYREDRKLFRRALRKDMAIPADRVVNLGHLVEPTDIPGVIYKLRPNLQPPVIYKDATTSTNSAGFRDREYPVEKADGVVRILGLGDSVMFGEGVHDGEEFLSLLEVELNVRHPERTWEVINTAVPGYNTAIEVAVLAALGLAYTPDIVVLGYLANDTSLPYFVRDERDVFDLEHSFLLQALPFRPRPEPWAPTPRIGLTYAPDRPLGGFAGGGVEIDRIPSAYRHMVGSAAVVRALDRLLELAEEHGFEVLFFSQSRPRPQTEEILDAARRRGLEPVDFGSELKAYMQRHGIVRYEGSILTLSAADAHPSRLAHRMAARSLLEALEGRGLVANHLGEPGAP